MIHNRAAEALLVAVNALDAHEAFSPAHEKACAAYEDLTGFTPGDVRDPRSYTNADAWHEALQRDWQDDEEQQNEAQRLAALGYDAVCARRWEG